MKLEYMSKKNLKRVRSTSDSDRVRCISTEGKNIAIKNLYK